MRPAAAARAPPAASSRTPSSAAISPRVTAGPTEWRGTRRQRRQGRLAAAAPGRPRALRRGRCARARSYSRARRHVAVASRMRGTPASDRASTGSSSRPCDSPRAPRSDARPAVRRPPDRDAGTPTRATRQSPAGTRAGLRPSAGRRRRPWRARACPASRGTAAPRRGLELGQRRIGGQRGLEAGQASASRSSEQRQPATDQRRHVGPVALSARSNARAHPSRGRAPARRRPAPSRRAKTRCRFSTAANSRSALRKSSGCRYRQPRSSRLELAGGLRARRETRTRDAAARR